MSARFVETDEFISIDVSDLSAELHKHLDARVSVLFSEATGADE